MRVKIIRDHADGCNAVKSVEHGDWPSPWFLPLLSGGSYPCQIVRRDSIGRNLRRGATGTEWVFAICNSTNCNAKVLVSVRDIEDVIEHALPARGAL